jgi:hypothetical protein
VKQPTAGDWVEATLVEQFERVLGDGGTFAEREASALDLANRVVREVLKRDLERMATQYGDEVVVDGIRHRRHSSGVRAYHSLCGPIRIRRDTYRQIGVHNGSTVVPLESEAGILENATPALAESVVQAFAMMPLRHYEEEMRAAHRFVPSRSTLERISKRIGTLLQADAPTIERVARARETLAKEAVSISIGLDRTTVPMREFQSARRPPKTKSHVRQRLPPVEVAYRMAYVATIATHDRNGEAISSLRITAAAHEGSTELMERLGDELTHLLAQRPKLPVVVVQDGAQELWCLVDEWLENYAIRPALCLLDRYHVDERLARCAEAVEKDITARQVLLRRWRASLDRSDAAVRGIYRELDRRLYAAPPPDAKENPAYWLWHAPTLLLGDEPARVVEDNITYFRKNRARMCYATARKQRLPIGSGVTEGACKSVIAARFKRSGQRWATTGVAPCLYARTLFLNQRLSPGLAFLVEQETERVARA